MNARKLLSPIVLALAVAALPAWSAAPKGPHNPANPLGADSIVNPLLPSPG